MFRTISTHRPRIVVGVLALLLAAAAVADDRDLLRTSSSEPYVTIILDTSGSMHWTPPCSEEDATLDIDPWDGVCTSECPMGSATCAQVCPDLGCIEYAEDATATTPIEYIIDNEDSGVVATGDFVQNSGGYDGTSYQAEFGDTGSVTFTPNLPQAGTWHVYGYWRDQGVMDEDVMLELEHRNGTVEFEVDMEKNQTAWTWAYLGTFEFDAGTGASITFTADGSGRVEADALRFWMLPPPTSPTCLQTGYRCEQRLCPLGDCRSPLSADDPSSKFFQAKQALYEVLRETPDVHFGFGTFEQDNGRVRFKHWMYRLRDRQPDGDPQNTWPLAGGQFPPPDARVIFGDGQTGDGDYPDAGDAEIDCVNTGYDTDDRRYDDTRIGCRAEFPADYNDIWEMERAMRVPKLGRYGEEFQTHIYVRDTDDQVYRFDFEDLRDEGGNNYDYGDSTIGMWMDVRRCLNADCSSRQNLAANRVIYFDVVSEYATWNNRIGRMPFAPGEGYFDRHSGVQAQRTCEGLEENNDWDDNNSDYGPFTSASDDDAWWGYTYKFPTSFDPRGAFAPDGTALGTRSDVFDAGDFVPPDWDDTNNELIRERLAPNTVLASAADPDFRVATYFQDFVLSGDQPTFSRRKLRLRDERVRPLVSFGSTPLAASLNNFRSWYSEWKLYGQAYDGDWACRQKYVLLLTDGDETCDGQSAACAAARTLLEDHQVRTFVVGFGLPGGGDALTCMASNGGTGEPILPRNKDELVQALRDILIQVRAESRAFASASIPAVQSTAADKIYLSSFTPVPGASVWPGRVDVFRQPLPLTDDNEPDVDRPCNAGRQSACHLYDVGEKLISQAPSETMVQATPPDYNFGFTDTTRRVLYGQENPSRVRPGPLRLLEPPTRNSTYSGAAFDRTDLFEAFFPPEFVNADSFVPGVLSSEVQKDLTLQKIVGETLRLKEEEILNDEGVPVGCDGRTTTAPCRYVLGDIFHANPVVLNSPNDFNFYQRNLCGTPPPAGQPNNCFFPTGVTTSDRGYQEFVLRNVWRRRMLATANNDGQMHFFDAGRYTTATSSAAGSSPIEVFTDGTGKELFSYMPRYAMPAVRDQALDTQHIYSLDGSLTLGDAFIDPVGTPVAEDREWRSIVIGSMREGGDVFEQSVDTPGFVSAYFALDITYPDPLETDADRSGRGATAFDPYLPAETGFLPGCLSIDMSSSGRQNTNSACDTMSGESMPFPAQMWVFADTININGAEYFLDEERIPIDLNADLIHDGGYLSAPSVQNGIPDLGQTWSQAVIGQVPVCIGSACDYTDPAGGSADDVSTRWVAIIGGGIDPTVGGLPPQRGTFLYMIDLETGEALYKRQVEGSVAAKPTAVDVDDDGVLDTIYVGTTAGYVYKVDLTTLTSAGDVPSIMDHQIPVSDIIDYTPPIGETFRTVRRITDEAWDPFPIYKIDSPLYYSPTAFFIPERGQRGLAFGVGHRQDLWSELNAPSYFIVMVDEDFNAAQASVGAIPVTPSEQYVFNFDQLRDDISPTPPSNPLLDLPTADYPRPGWVMTLPIGTKATAEPFLLVGILIFTVFEPSEPGAGATGGLCARTGTTFRFVVDIETGEPLVSDDDLCTGGAGGGTGGTGGGGDGTDDGDGSGGDTCGTGCGRGRCTTIDDFTTAIHTDQTVTKNPPPPANDGNNIVREATEDRTVDAAVIEALRQRILERLPSNCTVNDAFNLMVSALNSDTSLNVYAQIPLVACPGDWRS
ncbi:MAG: hypothetical protein AAGC60_11730 [Acidobacteriota bacterium]